MKTIVSIGFKSIPVLTGILFFSLKSFAGLELQAISVTPLAAVSGQSISGSVRLTEGCKTTSGCVVSLKSSNTTAATVPTSVIINAGGNSKTFSFIAGNVSAKTAVTITATFDGKSVSTGTSFSVSPSGTSAAPASCSFNGQTIASGSSVTAYQSSSVAAGQSCLSQSRTCTNGVLSGSYQYASCSAQASTAAASLGSWQSSAVDLAGAFVRTEYVNVNEYAKFNGSLSAPCDNTAGCMIYYTSSHPQFAPVSAWSQLYPGMTTFSTTAAFNTLGADLSTWPDTFTLTVTATYNGVTKSASIPVIVRPPLAVGSISHGDFYSGVPMGGQKVLYTVSMTGLCMNTSGCNIALASSNMAIMPVPSSVTVPNGGSWAQFSFATGNLSATTAVTLQAAYAGSIARMTYNVKASWPRLADGTIVMQAYGDDYVGSTVNTYRDPYADSLAYQAMLTQVDTLLVGQCQLAYPGTGRMVAQGSPVYTRVTYSSGAIYAIVQQTYHCYPR